MRTNLSRDKERKLKPISPLKSLKKKLLESGKPSKNKTNGLTK